jgi:hypothetical protein
MRKIFGPKGEKVTGDWRKSHNEELHDLYFNHLLFESSNQGELDGSDM